MENQRIVSCLIWSTNIIQIHSKHITRKCTHITCKKCFRQQTCHLDWAQLRACVEGPGPRLRFGARLHCTWEDGQLGMISDSRPPGLWNLRLWTTGELWGWQLGVRGEIKRGSGRGRSRKRLRWRGRGTCAGHPRVWGFCELFWLDLVFSSL